MKKEIKKLIENPEEYLLNINLDILIKLIKYTSNKYYNNQSIISDDIFDLLIIKLKKLDNNNKILFEIGSSVKDKLKCKLPYYMGSMNKIINSNDINEVTENEKILNKFIKIYKGSYVISDKLDGISGLFIKNNNIYNLYTRGDGIEGTDISYIIQYISSFNNINLLKDNIAIRGELIISKKNFLKYESIFANSRNMVSGIINSKKFNKSMVNDIEFIVYEIINPWINNQSEQFKILNDIGFKVVNNLQYNYDILNFNNLSTILIKEKIKSEYEIDGIIISNNILDTQRTINNNPTYAFAYKDKKLQESIQVKVINVEWNISKDGYIKPKLNIEPTKLSGVIISNVTAFNAKYIKDNILGPGAIIEIIRSGDVIPHILKVIKNSTSGKPQFPEYEYIWTISEVDIIITKECIEKNIKNLTFFFKKLNIKNINEAIVKKMINVNIDSIYKILNIKFEDLIKIEGFKDKMANKIYNNIINRINNLNILDLMISSNCFGHGISEKKLKKIINVYTDIIQFYIDNSSNDIINKIIQIEGFDIITATKFNEGLEKFINLFNSLNPDFRKKLRINLIDEVNITNKFKDIIIVFSGFRNKDWEKKIEDEGGKISSAVSSKTTLLVVLDINQQNSKIIKAKELNILIIEKYKFEKDYF